MKASLKRTARIVLISLAGLSVLFLIRGWYLQIHAHLSCTAKFDPLREHNGYIQINVLGPHPTEEMFDGELFLYYPAYQTPKNSTRIVREAGGSFAQSIIDANLIPWSKGLATPAPIKIGIPTPGSSQRRFPFDSANLDLKLSIQPPIRPSVVIIRNLSPDFVPQCSALKANWDGAGQLQISIPFRRNPFVQITVVLIGFASIVFAAMLGLIKKEEDLAVATASYFFSIWSIRSIVVPSTLGYSSLLDLWLMAICLLVLFILGWRLTSRVA